jgi:adenylyltransferase/sulfurtransferase
MLQPVKTLTVEELKSMMDEKKEFQLIDVREKSEKDYADIGGALIPMGTILQRVGEIRRDIPVIIYCRSGNRSGRVVSTLQEKFGFTNLYNLAGGILAWAERIDPGIRKY